MARKIEVTIVGDASKLEKSFRQAGRSADTFSAKIGSSLGGLSKGALAAGTAIGGLSIAIGVKSVQAASSLGEQINKTSAVFGNSARGIQKWAETTAAAIGISNIEALKATGTFGNMLVPMGLARGVAARISQRFVKLAADLASFNDASPVEVLDALRSGLAGETEPLRKFGVFLNASRVKAEALRKGLAKKGKELTAGAKALATYSIILKDTKDAQGDFARTSGSLPNLIRSIKAVVDDLAAAFGTGLLPVVQQVAKDLKERLADPAFKDRITELGRTVGEKLLAAVQAVGKWFRDNWDTIKAAFRTAKDVANNLKTAIGGIKKALETLDDVLPGGSKTLIGAIIAGLVTKKVLAISRAVAALKTDLTKLAAGKYALKIGIGLTIAGIIYGPLKKLFEQGLGANFQGITPGGLPPVKRGGKWVNPVTGQPVPGQDFWNRRAGLITGAGVGRGIGRGGGVGRAAGGPVVPGVAYRVGERGPETFVSGSSGRIVPNGAGGVYIAGDIHLHGIQNPREMLAALQRMSKNTSAQTRGRYGGTALGLV